MTCTSAALPDWMQLLGSLFWKVKVTARLWILHDSFCVCVACIFELSEKQEWGTGHTQWNIFPNKPSMRCCLWRTRPQQEFISLKNFIVWHACVKPVNICCGRLRQWRSKEVWRRGVHLFSLSTNGFCFWTVWCTGLELALMHHTVHYATSMSLCLMPSGSRLLRELGPFCSWPMEVPHRSETCTLITVIQYVIAPAGTPCTFCCQSPGLQLGASHHEQVVNTHFIWSFLFFPPCIIDDMLSNALESK